MLTQTIAMTAGQTVKFTDIGNFLRVLEAQDAITVRTYKNGQIYTESEGVFGGFAEKFDEQFQQVEVYTATAQTVQLIIRLGSIVSYDVSPTGNVIVVDPVALDAATILAINNGAIVPIRATGANTQKTVTNASAQLVAANAARKYLLIQNNDATGHVYVNFGAAATISNGVKIAAGGSFELNSNILTAEIFAIGSIGSNANVVVVEG